MGNLLFYRCGANHFQRDLDSWRKRASSAAISDLAVVLGTSNASAMHDGTDVQTGMHASRKGEKLPISGKPENGDICGLARSGIAGPGSDVQLEPVLVQNGVEGKRGKERYTIKQANT